jgi:hypothetical protein
MERFMTQFAGFLGAELFTAVVCIGGIWAFCRSLRKIGSTRFNPGKATTFWVIAVTSLLNVTIPLIATWLSILCFAMFLVSIPVSLLAGPINRRRKKASPTEPSGVANNTPESAWFPASKK